jgi:hypothetical protein
MTSNYKIFMRRRVSARLLQMQVLLVVFPQSLQRPVGKCVACRSVNWLNSGQPLSSATTLTSVSSCADCRSILLLRGQRVASATTMSSVTLEEKENSRRDEWPVAKACHAFVELSAKQSVIFSTRRVGQLFARPRTKPSMTVP